MSTFGVNTIVRKSDHVLLVKRSDFDIWALPGGGINNGESVEAAAIRETKEETGIEIEINRLVGVYSRPKWKDGGDHSIVFLCKPKTNNYKPDKQETVNCKYFEKDRLPFDIWPPHIEMIKDSFSELASLFIKSQSYSWKLGEKVGWDEAIKRFKISGLSGIEFIQNTLIQSDCIKL